MNIYRYQFEATCPNDGEVITYSLRIKTGAVIQAERIVAKCKFTAPAFHETIADDLYGTLGGDEQSLTATHCGVHIETLRGTI